MNLADLRRTLGVDNDDLDGLGRGSSLSHAEADDDGLYGADNKARQRRLSMERMDLLKVCLLAYLDLLASPPLLPFVSHGPHASDFDLFYFRFIFFVIVGDVVHALSTLFEFSVHSLIPCLKCIQLTPDVKHLYGKGRKLHDMDAVWPKPKACIIDRPPPFVVSYCFYVAKTRSFVSHQPIYFCFCSIVCSLIRLRLLINGIIIYLCCFACVVNVPILVLPPIRLMEML